MGMRGFLPIFLAAVTLLIGTGPVDRAAGYLNRDEASSAWSMGLKNSWGGVRIHRGLADTSGGCLAVGDTGYSSNRDGWAVHLDKTGAILKQMTYAGKNNDRLTSLCAATDAGYLAAGWTQFTGTGFFEEGGVGWLLKLRADLSPVWAKSYSASKTSSRFVRVIKLTKASGYLAILEFEDEYYYYNAVLRLNASGSVAWAYKLGDHEFRFDVREVLPTADGGFYLVGSGSGQSTSENGLIIRLASNGRPVWAKTVGQGVPVYERLQSAFLTGGGDLMVFGANHTEQAGLALKLDAKGNVKWQYFYKDPALFSTGLSLGLPGGGSGFYILGSYCYNGVRTLFAKCDATGRILAKKAYLAFGGPAPNYAEYVAHVFPSSDGGIFLLSSDVMSMDAVAAKLDAAGSLPAKCRPLSYGLSRSRSNYVPESLTIPWSAVKVTVRPAAAVAKLSTYVSTPVCR